MKNLDRFLSFLSIYTDPSFNRFTVGLLIIKNLSIGWFFEIIVLYMTDRVLMIIQIRTTLNITSFSLKTILIFMGKMQSRLWLVR
jgi:hypothetical protein